jgi:hypothetical protein
MSASNNFYPVNSPNLTVTTNSSSSFTISIDTPAGASSNIAKFTTQTTAHNTTSGATWQNASSIPSNSTWNAVAYGLGKFVAVGSSSSYASQAMYSTDGSNWTLTSVAPAYTAQSIAFGNGTFVAVSNVGVMYSTNGTSWSVAAQSFINGSSVVFGSGKFVVSVSSGYYYSTDGNNWTLVNLGSTRAHLAFGLGNFVGLGSAQNVASSADGITWNFTNDSNAQSLYLGPVAYGNGTFVSLVISGVPYALYSTNGGSSWTKFSIGTDNINSIAYGNGNFVGIGWDAVGSVSYGMTSINGTAWSVSSGIPTGNWKSITYGQGKFVIVASTGQVAFS